MNIWHKIISKIRILNCQLLSDNIKRVGYPIVFQPMLYKGKGSVTFGENVKFGVYNSPNFYSTYCFLYVAENSMINFGNNISISNNFSIEANFSVIIEDNVLIGTNCKILDNDGHFLDPDKRIEKYKEGKEIVIKQNVFIGDNVTLLKGVVIGKNSVIGNGSVVTKSFPENSIIAGNPAQLIKSL